MKKPLIMLCVLISVLTTSCARLGSKEKNVEIQAKTVIWEGVEYKCIDEDSMRDVLKEALHR